MPDIDTHKLIDGTIRTVEELFGKKYGLDYYQREYNWTESNISELLKDLADSFLKDYDQHQERDEVKSYQPYFLGPIVTSFAQGTHFIVDGQQRLTSLTLLLIHLEHCTKGLEDIADLGRLVYSNDYGTATFKIDVRERRDVMEAIRRGDTFDPANASQSVRTIWERYQDINRLFSEELTGHALPYFCDWLLKHVVLVEIGTTDQDMALGIFETMNDRGLRLSNTDMLKAYILTHIKDPGTILAVNTLWRQRITDLTDLEKNADSEFLKNWLRGKYAASIRERKKDALPKDFDLIGTAFHKWVRDNKNTLNLHQPSDYANFVDHDFDRLSQRYIRLMVASNKLTAGLEHVFYNASIGFTLQHLPILAAVTPDDDDSAFDQKAELIARYLNIFVARRMVNFRNFGYSTIVYTIFNLAKEIRNTDLEQLRSILSDRVSEIPQSFDGVQSFHLTQRNGTHIRYLLARMTHWVEDQANTGIGFPEYVNRQRKYPFEVEHIWADKYERHAQEFDNPYTFAEHRNRFGDLLLLPKDFNASFGAADYEDKLPNYYGQNLLAASLNEYAYSNNPSFTSFIDRTGLPFKPYPSGFTKSDIEERQDLYRQICEQVWNPGRLGLG